MEGLYHACALDTNPILGKLLPWYNWSLSDSSDLNNPVVAKNEMSMACLTQNHNVY